MESHTGGKPDPTRADAGCDRPACPGQRGKWVRGPAAVLMTLHALLLAWGAWRHSPTWDEAAYLPAGISHWQLREFELYRVNPPLVRAVCVVPVLLAGPQTDWNDSPDPWRVGRDFLTANGERSFWLFTMARWVCIPFSLLGGYVCFRWAGELFGNSAGILALALWCFSPNIIAHGQLITPDVATAALGLAAAYAFWRWLKLPTWRTALITGIVLGLAELVKATWIILFVLWPALWVVWRWPGRRELSRRVWLRECCQLATILLLGLYLINVGYGFQGSLARLDSYEFVSRDLGGPKCGRDLLGRTTGNRFRGTWLAAVRVPLPWQYLAGLDEQKRNLGYNQWSYLNGEWHLGGQWHYYVYALAIKVPLGTWGLIALALMAAVWHPAYRSSWRDELVLLAPMLIVLVLISSQTCFNRHSRYVLPMFPFAFVLTGRLGRAVCLRHLKTASLAAVLLLWSAAGSLWVYPHSLSYFNELVGGPTGGPDHLGASNTDWGQDLLYLKRWLEEHPEAHPLRLAFDGGYPPTSVGIDCQRPPVGPDPSANRRQVPNQLGPQPGWYAVSVNLVRSRDRRYAYFLRFCPVDRIGYSMNVYHVTPEEADRVRAELGLPPWKPPSTPAGSSVNRRGLGPGRARSSLSDQAGYVRPPPELRDHWWRLCTNQDTRTPKSN